MDYLKKLYIEPTSLCNLNCEMCFRNTWFDEKLCEMSYDAYKKLIETLPKETEIIFFGGMGEPLYHPQIIEMIVDCSRKGKRVELLTNGTLINENMVNDLIKSGLSKLWISIDSIDENNEIDENNIGHPSNKNIIEKISEFNRIRNKNNSGIELGITFVATKSNVSQLSKLPYFIERYNINEVNISNMYPSDKKAQEEILYKKTLNMSLGSDAFGKGRPIVNLPYMDFSLNEVKEGLNGLFSKMNFNLQVGSIPVPRRSKYCRFVNEGMAFVRSDGNVSPCMELLHNGTTVIEDTERKVYHHSFGNIKDNNIIEIWQSKEYIEFRKRVKEFSFSPCTNCGHCSYTEENKEDCFGNVKPTCGACLWAEGLLSCP